MTSILVNLNTALAAVVKHSVFVKPGLFSKSITSTLKKSERTLQNVKSNKYSNHQPDSTLLEKSVKVSQAIVIINLHRIMYHIL